jgi:tetratricopeptide (TPR) repeat protein
VLLIWLLVAAQPLPVPSVRPQYDLANYLAVATAYRSPNRALARREIREWRSREIEAALRALREEGDRLRAVAVHTGDIDFRTVEAAVLLHAEVGLASLQAMSLAEAEFHLDASVRLLEWSRHAAARARSFDNVRAYIDARDDRLPTHPRAIRDRIDLGDFYKVLAGTSLAVGFPLTARPFADGAVRASPMDPGAHLIAGCVNASLAEEFTLRRRESDAQRAREAAEKALRDALALEPGLQEAHLRLGKLLLDLGRAVEAEPLLAGVGERADDERQRYLARLFLGRVVERLGRPEEALRLYRLALDAWPDSQAARLALAHALELSSGPAAPLVLVGATLGASRRPDRVEDPWWFYLSGPLELTRALLDRVWARALDP